MMIRWRRYESGRGTWFLACGGWRRQVTTRRRGTLLHLFCFWNARVLDGERLEVAAGVVVAAGIVPLPLARLIEDDVTRDSDSASVRVEEA
jgi:hypothetical protein